ncbi:purine-nucleoside phosphorylase [Bariatricus sp. SGI.154]|uniref:purine-nucleoside phosphorylase n=1 Tax=Bariatricus sp. SGI.154 TaxID=3420549 RepID=UPI003CFF3DF8
MKELEMIQACVRIIREKTDIVPEVGLILGSGLGDYADRIENKVIVPYSELPEFPVSTVAGHMGQFVIGEINGRNVIAMQGRVHYYEGYSQRKITMPVRIMKGLGVGKMILTNAAGGVNRSFKPGTLMMLQDHINFSGNNPLIGENPKEFGARFPDMSSIYSTEYRAKLKKLAAKEGIELEEGIYMMMSGPSYETPAEVRMAGILGADAVGMSTVPEAIVCAQSRISVLGISCITNCAAGIQNQPLNHAEVVETANRVKEEFVKVLDIALREVVF